jgi:DNA-binding response OmpR family regulator/DNA-binding CsgD family transcriptional regulator
MRKASGTFWLLLRIAVLPRYSRSYSTLAGLLQLTSTKLPLTPIATGTRSTSRTIHSKRFRTRQQLYSTNTNNNNIDDDDDDGNDEHGDDEIEHETKQRATSWILLVEDEEPIRRAVGDFFLDKGYQVTTCSDGAAALELLAKSCNGEATNSNNNDNTLMTGEEENERITKTTTKTRHLPNVPDCIVSDIRMPVMDGLELLRNIRNENNNEYNANANSNANANNNNNMHMLLSHVPVVLLTAKGYTQDRIAGYDAGADAYLTKPFSPDELVAIVDNLIQRSTNLGVQHTDTTKDVGFDDLTRDLHHIKTLLLHKGGAGKFGNGWVERTNIFLSTDERAVLELLSRGLMTKEIAVRTHLSTRKIEQLLTGMFRKIGVKNRTELVRWAVSTGNAE